MEELAKWACIAGGIAIAVIVLGCVGMWRFHVPIARLIDRVRKAGPLHMDAATEQKDTSIPKAIAGADTVTGLPALNESAGVISGQQTRVVVTNSPAEAEVLRRQSRRTDLAPDPTEAAEQLKIDLARCSLRAHFEFVAGQLFVSQYDFLKTLNVAGGVQPIATAQARFAKAKSELPAFYDDFSFDNWLRFMLTMELVVTENETVRLTIFGKDYLVFMAVQGRNEPRWG